MIYQFQQIIDGVYEASKPFPVGALSEDLRGAVQTD